MTDHPPDVDTNRKVDALLMMAVADHIETYIRQEREGKTGPVAASLDRVLAKLREYRNEFVDILAS